MSKLKLDLSSVSAALLHDILEDTNTSSEELKDKFGEEVLFLVESLSHLNRLKHKANYKNKTIGRLENLRNLILSSAKDIRVILIKIIDRLDNRKPFGLYRKNKENAEDIRNICAHLSPIRF